MRYLNRAIIVRSYTVNRTEPVQLNPEPASSAFILRPKLKQKRLIGLLQLGGTVIAKRGSEQEG